MSNRNVPSPENNLPAMFDDDDDRIDHRSHPMYIKGMEIFDLVHALIQLLPEEEDHMLHHYRGMMMADAMVLNAKFAGAVNMDLYDLKMENAAIMRKAARDLLTATSGLRAFGFQDTQYLPLLRTAIEEYRLLFVDWVDTFDPWNYIIDRWGLFNPPGVTAHDHDPDDDLPWDGPEEE